MKSAWKVGAAAAVVACAQALLVAVPSTVLAQAAAGAGEAAGNSIERIDATQTGTNTIVTIQLKGAAAGVPPSFSVANPARIAIDLPQTANNLGRNLVEVNQGDLRSVNVVQAQGRSRVVLNLRRPVTHAISVDGNVVTVALGASSDTSTFRAAEAAPAHPAAPPPPPRPRGPARCAASTSGAAAKARAGSWWTCRIRTPASTSASRASRSWSTSLTPRCRRRCAGAWT
jgi:type IV pilus assembly protein PilQ